MKLFIDAYGDVALLCIRQLIEQHLVRKADIFIRTYDSKENVNLLDYLKDVNFNFTFDAYNTRMLSNLNSFRPEFILSLFGRSRIPIEKINGVERSMNLHPSLLPVYKGCFSVPWVIINNEDYTGVTFHEISEKLDEGNIIYQQRCEIYDTDTAESLYARLNFMFYNNFTRIFEEYNNGQITPKSQSGAISSYYPRKLPFDGIVDPLWDSDTKNRFIRAMYFPPFEPAVNSKNELITG